MFNAGDTFDKYVIVRELGQGGMGLVYQARNKLGLPVVLKMLHPDYAGDSVIRERFFREYTAWIEAVARVTRDAARAPAKPARLAPMERFEPLLLPAAGPRRISASVFQAPQSLHWPCHLA